ncbi:MAG: hypothetical protein K5657_08595 [Desulfovibrio sp.]|nr:hypothetical protein [Desulfovibrio sp.]
MKIDPEHLFYDLHYDRKDWSSLNEGQRRSLSRLLTAGDTRERIWARKCVDEALRMDPSGVFRTLSYAAKKLSTAPYLDRVGPEGLALLTHDVLGGRKKEAGEVRIRAIRYLAEKGSTPCSVIRYLRKDDFRNPALRSLLCRMLHSSPWPIGDALSFIPKMALENDRELFLAVLKNDASALRDLHPSLLSNIQKPQGDENRENLLKGICERRSGDSTSSRKHAENECLSGKSGSHGGDAEAQRTILMVQNIRGRRRFWEVGRLPHAEEARLDHDALSDDERMAVATAPRSPCLGLISGTKAFFYGITGAMQDAARSLAQFTREWGKKFCGATRSDTGFHEKSLNTRLSLFFIQARWLGAGIALAITSLCKKGNKREAQPDLSSIPSPSFFARALPEALSVLWENASALPLSHASLLACSREAQRDILSLLREGETTLARIAKGVMEPESTEHAILLLSLADPDTVSTEIYARGISELMKHVQGDMAHEKAEHALLRRLRTLGPKKQQEICDAILSLSPDRFSLLRDAREHSEEPAGDERTRKEHPAC